AHYYGLVRHRVPEEAGVPLAHLEAGVPRLAHGPAADHAARVRAGVRRPPRVQPRRRLPLPRLEPLRPPRPAAPQALPGRGRLTRLLPGGLLPEHGVRRPAEVRLR